MYSRYMSLDKIDIIGTHLVTIKHVCIPPILFVHFVFCKKNNTFEHISGLHESLMIYEY